MAAALRECGLDCVSTHTNWDRFLGDLDAVIEEHKVWGCSHPAIGGLPKEYHSLDGLKRFADELPPIAERLAQEGMTFSYHNHNHELALYNGKTWLERLYGSIDERYLKAEIDTYWIQAGGGDPAAWVRRYAGRQPLLHLKDMAVTPEREQRLRRDRGGEPQLARHHEGGQGGGRRAVPGGTGPVRGPRPLRVAGHQLPQSPGHGAQVEPSPGQDTAVNDIVVATLFASLPQGRGNV